MKDIVEVGSAPAIDALILVADRGQVATPSLLSLESAFGIRFTPREIMAFNSIGDITRLVRKQLEATNGPP